MVNHVNLATLIEPLNFSRKVKKIYMKNCYAIAFCMCVDVKNRRSLCREPGLMEGAEESRREQ